MELLQECIEDFASMLEKINNQIMILILLAGLRIQCGEVAFVRNELLDLTNNMFEYHAEQWLQEIVLLAN
ncbi:hypothetical protein M404DRAFT_20078 [Pisolithus tinctorius Marx 270]|uniref:Uncharacterized protein n=1 Tax=Pisolithus tinctorius Marx 270 TaxID=870435 RepID=A0A0C3KRU6_PISTI|nr:hypothetical protein M404DRAFT_20078 [Pisolithus tinctorius Marx 270]